MQPWCWDLDYPGVIPEQKPIEWKVCCVVTARHVWWVGVLSVAVLLLGVSEALLRSQWHIGQCRRSQWDVVWRQSRTRRVSPMSRDVPAVLWPRLQPVPKLLHSPSLDRWPPVYRRRCWPSSLSTGRCGYCSVTSCGRRRCGSHRLAVADQQTKFQQVSHRLSYRLWLLS